MRIRDKTMMDRMNAEPAEKVLADLEAKHGSVQRSVRPIYSRRKPTTPGWYWCLNEGDNPPQKWEAVVFIEARADGLVCSWMTAAGKSGIMYENEWSEETLWAGPLHPPDWPNIVLGEQASDAAKRK